jgi:hypothetical protein
VKAPLVVGKLGAVPITAFGSDASGLVGFGFVSEPTKAIGFALDPGTLQARVSFTKPTRSPIRAVVPYPLADGMAFAVDEDDPKALQRTPLTLPAPEPVTVRSFKKALTVARGTGADPEVAWLLPSELPVLRLAGVAAHGKGFFLAVRTEDALRVGWLGADGKPLGTLHDVPDAGKPGSSLGVASNGQSGLLLLRAGEGDAAGPIRMATTPVGTAPAALAAWVAPEGGPGGEWSLPVATGLADGRWLLVWAEGKKAERQLRMQTYDAALRPLGAPVTAGEGKAYVGGAAAVGRAGGVLVLRATEGAFDRVSAVGLDCS